MVLRLIFPNSFYYFHTCYRSSIPETKTVLACVFQITSSRKYSNNLYLVLKELQKLGEVRTCPERT